MRRPETNVVESVYVSFLCHQKEDVDQGNTVEFCFFPGNINYIPLQDTEEASIQAVLCSETTPALIASMETQVWTLRIWYRARELLALIKAGILFWNTYKKSWRLYQRIFLEEHRHLWKVSRRGLSFNQWADAMLTNKGFYLRSCGTCERRNCRASGVPVWQGLQWMCAKCWNRNQVAREAPRGDTILSMSLPPPTATWA